MGGEKQKHRSKVQQIEEEIAGLERTKDATNQLASGIRMLGDGLHEIGNAIQEMLMVGTESQLADAREHLELHRPDPEHLQQSLMEATERLQQAEGYRDRLQAGVNEIPEEYRGFLSMLMPLVDMQIQMGSERVKQLREELEELMPMPDATLPADQVDAEFVPDEEAE